MHPFVKGKTKETKTKTFPPSPSKTDKKKTHIVFAIYHQDLAVKEESVAILLVFREHFMKVFFFFFYL